MLILTLHTAPFLPQVASACVLARSRVSAVVMVTEPSLLWATTRARRVVDGGGVRARAGES